MSETNIDHRIDVRPGQLWSWNFNVGTGWWTFEIVSEAARKFRSYLGTYMALQNQDRFIIVAVDDPGPSKPFGHTLVDEMGHIQVEPIERWHVAMAQEKLF